MRSRVIGLAFGLSLTPSVAVAGNDTHLQIVAASADGRHLAVVVNGDPSGRWVCGLSKPRPALPLTHASLQVNAECGGGGPLLPFEQWTWSRPTAEVRRLRKLQPVEPANTPARIVIDPDTQVRRLEVLQQGTWYAVFADEASTVDESSAETRYGSPGLTTPGKLSQIRGFLRDKDRIVLTFSNTDPYGLIVVDDLIALSTDEVTAVDGRLARAREQARERTKALREQYAARSGAFVERGQNEKSRARRRAVAARTAVKLWEQARVFGPLNADDLREALWLLGWLPTPTRRQEAMRLYLELHERDPSSAEAVIRELQADPATLPLAVRLQSRHDPLRGLPAVNGCSSTPISEVELKNLSDENLLWLHRAQWAAQGGYRFSDPAVQQYFEGFTWYAPVPKAAWRARATKSFRDDPDAALMKKVGNSTPADACKRNLEAIRKAERTRGLSPPSL